MAGMEAKEEEEKKEKEDNKIGVAEKSFHYCHAWCKFVIAILGLAYPLWTKTVQNARLH